MNSPRTRLALATGALVLLLGACSRSNDVPPGNNADTALDADDRAVETADVTDAQNPSETREEPAVKEEDVLPELASEGGEQPDRVAWATLQPTQGNTVSGLVAFVQPDALVERVRVVGELVGISPGAHGFHVHDDGTCEPADINASGGHYNPFGAQHGDRAANVKHLGDLGNIDANAAEVAEFDFEIEGASLSGPNSIAQRVVIVHAGPDDLRTDPNGNSGDPVACGIIRPNERQLVPE